MENERQPDNGSMPIDPQLVQMLASIAQTRKERDEFRDTIGQLKADLNASVTTCKEFRRERDAAIAECEFYKVYAVELRQILSSIIGMATDADNKLQAKHFANENTAAQSSG